MAYEDIVISAAEVVWDPDGTPIPFSPFFGNVNVNVETAVAPIKRDSFGSTVYDQVETGSEVIVTIPMTAVESARLGKIAGVTTSTNRHTVSGYSGTAHRALSKKVYIKPVVNGVVSINEEEWSVIPLGTPPRLTASFVFSGEGDQRVVLCEIRGLPADETGYEGKTFSFGENVVI